MKPLVPTQTALIVIDAQKAFEEIAAGGIQRNNPEAEARIADLLAAFRAAGLAIIHIRHASLEPASRFRAEASGFEVSEFARERTGELAVVKHVNSSFIGTDLEQRLRDAGLSTLVIVGATTNHCVETTTRMAGNLGFDARLVRDATWTFERIGPDGEHHAAKAIHAMTLSNLSDEFAEIVTADQIIEAIAQAGAGAGAAQNAA